MDVMAKHVHYLGASGAGHTLKLIHNNLCFTVFLATCEAGRQAMRCGLGIDEMINIFNKSNARSYATEERFPRHILNKKWDGRSSIYLLHKDLKLGVELCNRVGADANLTRATLGFIERAMNGHMASQDYTLLFRDYERIRKQPKGAIVSAKR
jgi:3-hydroxyisobutyrate dehydrogenase